MKNNLTHFDWFLNSPNRCHAVGAVVSLALLITTAWIWSNADAFAEDDRYTTKHIEEAGRLVANADQLRRKYADCVLISNQNKRRISEIRRWLPIEPNWEKTSQRIHSIAAAANIKLTVDKGEQHVGSRIGVQKVVCEMQCSYADICNLLTALANDQKPIWCDSIRIQRIPPNVKSEFECNAAITMRVPFVASDTVAAKLLQLETPNAG